MITRTCEFCGQDYETYPSQKPKYCSIQCANKARRKGDWIECAQCGERVYRRASQPNKKYCSISCAMTARNLTDANPSYHRDISGKNNPMYGKGFSGEDNPMYGKRKEQAPGWKGGRAVRPDGYVQVVVPDDYPSPAYTKPSGTKYALEHRVVMEEYLGRYLEEEEVVHHIDGDPTNNDIGNLRLFESQAQHVTLGHSDPNAMGTNAEYMRYLSSKDWQDKREAVLARANNRCEECGALEGKIGLHVHHETYERVFDERLDDLKVLCNPCHLRVTANAHSSD